MTRNTRNVRTLTRNTKAFDNECDAMRRTTNTKAFDEDCEAFGEKYEEFIE